MIVMKKISLFFLFICIIGWVLYLLTSHLESGVDPVSLLPVDTIGLVDLRNPAKSYVRYKQSRLGRQIDSISWDEVLKEIGLPEEQVVRITTWSDELRIILESPLFREIFGRRALFALLPGTDSVGSNTGPLDLRDRLLLICRPQHRASLLHFFSSFFAGHYEYTSYSFMGKAIKKYTFDNDLSVYSTVTDGLVIIALSEKPLKDSLVRSLKNMTTGGRTGLELNEEYRSLKKRTGGRDDQFIYADLKKMTEALNKGADAPENFMMNRINGGAYPVSIPFQSFVFFRQSEKSKLSYTTIIRVDREDFLESTGSLLFNPPVKNKTIQELPSDLIVYFWTNVFNFKYIWNLILHDTNGVQVEYLKNIEHWTISNTGLSKEQLLDLFGHQFSLNIAEIKTSGFFPVPRISLQIELVDRERVEDLVNTFLTGLPLRQSRIGSQDVYSVMLAGGLVQPSYAFIDDFLVIADSHEQMKQIVEDKKELLVQDPFFEKVDVGLTMPNNFVLYLKSDELIDGLKGLFAWTGTLLSINGQKTGFVSKVVIDRVILPVLDGMKMYRVKAVRGYFNESEIILESALLIENE